ncbi:Tyrosine-protein phosphatase non-receptor type 2 [Blattella germanica]|nr:Tyrosine-protein phosphatase non-receptor type 2 [Blattella germanica]
MNSEVSKSNVETEFQEIDSKEKWPLLYQHIRNECLNYDYTFLEARKTHNKNLNRYRDVSPYDHSRVVLSRGPCDYINANLVTMERAHRRYILTQGPLPQTTGHFWLMVWEQNCKAVLMLNRIIEKNQVKCHQLTEVESGSSREIIHFHYTTWPDFGVPESPTAFLNFLMVVRESGVLDQNVGPPVVHCSAGIGRSGTFCLVDSCLVLIEEEGIDSVNVREVLLEMRRFRMGLIQTPDQLRFSYWAIIEGANKCIKGGSMRNDSGIDLTAITATITANHTHPQNMSMRDDDEPPPLPPPRGESLRNQDAAVNDNCDIKIGRLRWAGHIQRMKASEMVRKIMETKPEGRRKAGRPNLRWMDGILQNVKSLRLKNWWMIARGREAWRRTDSNLRKRKRHEQKERMAQQVKEMKRKQQAAESWQQMKRSLLQPLTIGIGVSVLLLGGALAYGYYASRV